MTTSGMNVAQAESLNQLLLTLSQEVRNARTAEAPGKQELVTSARTVYESIYQKFLARRKVNSKEVAPFMLRLSHFNFEITDLERALLSHSRRKAGVVKRIQK